MNPRQLLCALVCALPAAGAADAPAPEDFAVAFPVAVPTGATLVEVELDARVHRASTTSDLRDLRVFDADGRLLAQSLHRPGTSAPTPEPVPFFALPEAAATATGGVRVEVARDGTVVSVDGEERAPASDAGPRRWLLDRSGDRPAVDTLRFDWTPAPSGFVADVVVEVSDDLDRWRPVPVRGALAELERDGVHLRRDHLTLAAPTAANYLRVSLAGADVPVLTAVSVVAVSDAAPSVRWTPLTPASIAADGWWYDLGGPVPVDAVRVAASAGTHLFAADLAAAASPGDEAIALGRGAFHRAAVDGTTLVSDPVSVRIRNRRWLHLEPGAGAPPRAPALEVRYTPMLLRFVAEGAAPWQVAVGRRGTAQADGTGAAALVRLAEDASPVRATLGAPVTLAGDAAREPPASFGYLFWVALVLGVALLGWMLVRLAAEMRGTGEDDGGDASS
jgi:hypothetical protein